MLDGKKIDLNIYKNDSGVYKCAQCRHSIFIANKRFDAGCGFPSFWQALENGVKLNPLHTYGRYRVQLLCKQCNAHLGHLFQYNQTPTGQRYCINAEAIVKNVDNLQDE